jgi:hypothetical protein
MHAEERAAGSPRPKASKWGGSRKMNAHQRQEALCQCEVGEPTREIAPGLQCQPQQDFTPHSVTSTHNLWTVSMDAGWPTTLRRALH